MDMLVIPGTRLFLVIRRHLSPWVNHSHYSLCKYTPSSPSFAYIPSRCNNKLRFCNLLSWCLHFLKLSHMLLISVQSGYHHTIPLPHTQHFFCISLLISRPGSINLIKAHWKLSNSFARTRSNDNNFDINCINWMVPPPHSQQQCI